MNGESKDKVVVVVAPCEVPPFVVSPPKPADPEAERRREVLRTELASMREREENKKLLKKERQTEAARREKERVRKERLKKGITIYPETKEIKRSLSQAISAEERLALRDQQLRLRSQTAAIAAQIDRKLGITDLPKGEKLVQLASDFYCTDGMPNLHLPEHVRKELTTAEINDFRMVFELFDAKNRGYITADDLKRAAAMLGYSGKRKVFKEMMDGAKVDIRGRMSFVSFLELMIKLQGDGPDPFDDIRQSFQLLDRGEKGYLTFSDIRAGATDSGVTLSNKAIRAMMEEADMTGSGRVTLGEFAHMIAQAANFKTSM